MCCSRLCLIMCFLPNKCFWFTWRIGGNTVVDGLPVWTTWYPFSHCWLVLLLVLHSGRWRCRCRESHAAISGTMTTGWGIAVRIFVIFRGGGWGGRTGGIVILFKRQVFCAAQLCGQSLVVHMVLHILHLMEFRVHWWWQDAVAVVLLFSLAAASSFFPFFSVL